MIFCTRIILLFSFCLLHKIFPGLISLSEIRITALLDGREKQVFIKLIMAKMVCVPAISFQLWNRLFVHPTLPANQGLL
jgi:hypothetical protein